MKSDKTRQGSLLKWSIMDGGRRAYKKEGGLCAIALVPASADGRCKKKTNGTIYGTRFQSRFGPPTAGSWQAPRGLLGRPHSTLPDLT